MNAERLNFFFDQVSLEFESWGRVDKVYHKVLPG